MKKRYIFMIAICAILSLLVSCDGSVDEMLFVHKVTFDYGNGDPTVVKEVKHGETVDKPEDDPTKSGYVFKCWSLDGTNPFDFDNTAITKNITIKAVWGNLSKAGDIITLGEKDGVRITWKALSVDTEKKRALIVCEDVLEPSRKFDDNSNDYATSDIRTYLTNLGEDGFINTYGLDKSYMVQKEDLSDDGVTDKDYVFLLSKTEAGSDEGGYFEDNKARIALHNGNPVNWCLRSKDTNPAGNIMIVYSDGDLTSSAINYATGLRPAFWYTWATYEVGDKGPAGGTIFYVNPNAKEDGWRYLEAAPTALKEQEGETQEYKKYTWGSNGNYNTEEGVGKGKTNTEALLNAKESGSGLSFPAAEACADYSVNEDGIVYDDWFLPSIGELNLMYKEKDKLDSASVNNNNYWSSTGDGSNNELAKVRYFTGSQAWESNKRSTESYVWPVRRF